MNYIKNVASEKYRSEKWRKFRISEAVALAFVLGLVMGYFAFMVIGGYGWIGWSIQKIGGGL